MMTSRSPSSASDDLVPAESVRLARARRGMARAELGRRLGVASRVIAGWETHGLPRDRLVVVARALDVPIELLTTEHPELPRDGEVRFRAAKRATTAQREAARAAGALGIGFYDWLSARFGLPDVAVPDLDDEDPAMAALAVRGHWGYGTGPLPNLLQLSEANGIRVVGLPVDASSVDAFSLVRNDRPYVFLSSLKSPARSRFDLAHEIGHLVLHTRGHDGPEAEREADAFASELLMPAESLVAAAGREPATPQVLHLRDRFGVSAIAMTRRLHDLGILGDVTYRQNCIALAQRGFRRGEPGGIRREQSRVFAVTLGALLSSEWTMGSIAQEVGLLLDDLHVMTFGQFLQALAGGASRQIGGPRPQLRVV